MGYTPAMSNAGGDAPAGRRAKLLRRALLTLIALLYVLSIPWYRASGVEPEIVFGLPDWAAVALGCYVGVAILNSIAWLLTDVRDAEGDKGDEAG